MNFIPIEYVQSRPISDAGSEMSVKSSTVSCSLLISNILFLTVFLCARPEVCAGRAAD